MCRFRDDPDCEADSCSSFVFGLHFLLQSSLLSRFQLLVNKKKNKVKYNYEINGNILVNVQNKICVNELILLSH